MISYLVSLSRSATRRRMRVVHNHPVKRAGSQPGGFRSYYRIAPGPDPAYLGRSAFTGTGDVTRYWPDGSRVTLAGTARRPRRRRRSRRSRTTSRWGTRRPAWRPWRPAWSLASRMTAAALRASRIRYSAVPVGIGQPGAVVVAKPLERERVSVWTRPSAAPVAPADADPRVASSSRSSAPPAAALASSTL